MKELINMLFDLLGKGFDKIPLLNKLKGARSLVGFIGMAVVSQLMANNIGDPVIMGYVNMGLMGFCGLALNSKGRVK